MQKSYVVLKRVNITSAAFYIDKGDILVFDASNNNNLTVYRDQKLMKTTTHSQLGIAAMVKAKMIESIISVTDETPIADPDPLKLTLGQKIEEVGLVIELEAESVLDNAIDTAATLADKAGEQVLNAVHAIEAEAEKVFTGSETKAEESVAEAKDVLEDITLPIETTVTDGITKAEGEVADAKTSAEDAITSTEEKVDTVATDAKVEGQQIEATASDAEKIATDAATDVSKVGADVAAAVDPKKTKPATKGKGTK